MYQLLLLSAQHAGIQDVFTDLVPRWSCEALFDKIMGRSNADHLLLTTTWFQTWVTQEGINVSPKRVLDFFTKSPSDKCMSKQEFVWLLQGQNRLYHSIRRRIEGAYQVNTPQQVLIEQREVRKRNKNAAIAARRRPKRIPDKAAAYLQRTRAAYTTTLSHSFGASFGNYLPPDFQKTSVQENEQDDAVDPDTLKQDEFPSAAHGVMNSSRAFSTMQFSARLVNTDGDTVRSVLAKTLLDKLPRGQTTQKLLRQDSPTLAAQEKPAWMQPKTFKMSKPATYKLTNGDIGQSRKVLQWQPEDDEDTAVLPALPLTVEEETDAGRKLVEQVCTMQNGRYLLSICLQ